MLRVFLAEFPQYSCAVDPGYGEQATNAAGGMRAHTGRYPPEAKCALCVEENRGEYSIVCGWAVVLCDFPSW